MSEEARTKLSILLVEDNPGDTDLIREMLRQDRSETFEITAADCLSGALQLLADRAFDVVLLDLSLPDSSGLEALTRIQERDMTLPVIVSTGNRDGAMAAKAVQMGAQDYLFKGQTSDELLKRTLRYAMERHRILADLKSKGQDLRASENRYRQMIDKNADGILIVDREGLIQYANPSAEELLGRRQDELVGQRFGSPLVVGEATEIDISRGMGGAAVAEMRVVETEWENEVAYLVSLRDMTELVQLREELKALSLRDELTGLYNRRGFLTLAEQQLKHANRTKAGMVMFFADLDELKGINDTWGHPEGDRAIVATATILKHTFRDSDVIGRLGGDEFAVLAMVSDADDPAGVERRLEERIVAHNANTRGTYGLSVSVGAVRYDVERPCSINELLARADARMYEQKVANHEKRDEATWRSVPREESASTGPEQPQCANRKGSET